jgi:hypothetical protein
MTPEEQPKSNPGASQEHPKSRRRATGKIVRRSAVANGQRLIAGASKNSAEYRQYADVVSDLVDHLGDATVVQRAICEEAAGLVVWCRNARLQLLQGDPTFNIGQYTTATNALRRLLDDIGQERRMKDVTRTIDDFKRDIAERNAREGTGVGTSAAARSPEG